MVSGNAALYAVGRTLARWIRRGLVLVGAAAVLLSGWLMTGRSIGLGAARD